MGDIIAEPSMEEILSSIKRIIAEEGESTQARTRRPARPATAAPVEPDLESEEVLELSEPMPEPEPEPSPVVAAPLAEEPAAPILSQETAAASRGSLDALSKVVAHPEPAPVAAPVPAAGALDAVVRDMLRPMLRDWLDANLPAMVETMVAREIAKITDQR